MIKIEYIVVFFIIAFSVMLWPMVFGTISALLLLPMFFSAIYVPLRFPFLDYDEMPLYILLFLILSSSLNHLETFRFSTVCYSFGFVLSFICYMRILKFHQVKIDVFLDFMHRLIFVFFVVLIIQQLSVFLNLPVFNKHYIFTNPFKLNSLALEPSYLGSTITCFMYAHVKLWRKLYHVNENDNMTDFFANKYLWLCYVYISISCGSSWSLFAFALFNIYLFRKSRKAIYFISVIIAVFFPLLMNVESFYRVFNIIPVILSGNVELIRTIDSSASARVAPLLFYIRDLNLLSSDFWFGYGVDFCKSRMIFWLWGEYSQTLESQLNALGGIYAFFYDYGFITGLTFIWALKKFALKTWRSFPLILYFFCYSPNYFNTYMTWGFFIIMYSIIHYEKQLTNEGVCQTSPMCTC